MRRPIIRWLVVTFALGALGLAAFQGIAQPAAVSLSLLMPQGAALFVESKDFSELLKQWNASPEKQVWLKSENNEVFSRSRLLLRLKQAQSEFQEAAGIPPDMNLLEQVAGQQSALAIYDIGKLEMLFITRQPSARAMQNALWQQRSKFEPREVAGLHFFVRTHADSGRVVAFAVEGDYLILATREDLAAGALSLISKQKLSTLNDERWFADAVKQGKEPGNLRMVIHLANVTQTPQFRTYWVQQNNTEMQQYEASLTDLYRDGADYREERVLFRKSSDNVKNSDDDRMVANLAKLVPANAGFYRASAADVANALASLEQKVLTPHLGPAPAPKTAPSVSLGGGTVGNDSNLDVRIDTAPTAMAAAHGDQSLKAELTRANVRAILEVHRSEQATDGVFVELRSTVVLSSAMDWNDAAVRNAIQEVIAPGLTSGSLGVEWRQAGKGTGSYVELDGLEPIAVAVRGRNLFVSNDPETLEAVLVGSQGASTSQEETARYITGFNHASERQNFYKLMSLVDRPSRLGGNSNGAPEFFSQNLRSLSEVFAGVESMSVRATRNGAVETQTVRYHWSH